jgi:sugar lactone lactonase YvrE
MKKIMIVACMFYGMILNAQTISTIAGTTGDGLLALNIPINGIMSTITDSVGNVYFVEINSNKIRKIDANTRIVSTIAGNGVEGYNGDGIPATLASLNKPTGLAFDLQGNIYFSDQDNQRIRRINIRTGIINTVAGFSIKGFAPDGRLATNTYMDTPCGIATDLSGNIYYADYGNHRVRKVNVSTGLVSTVAGNGSVGFSGDGGIATLAKLAYPIGVAVDRLGNVYIVDGQSNRVRKVNVTNGIITTIAGNGTNGYSGDGGLATSANLNCNYGITVDANRNLYIPDGKNNRVRKVNASNGIISTIVGSGTPGYAGDSGLASSASLNYPIAVSFDYLGNMLISDLGNNRIRFINSSGIINSIAGNGHEKFAGDGGPATIASLNGPNALCFDKNGNIYISDSENRRIRKINSNNGTITTVAGSGMSVYSGDSGDATLAGLRYPDGVAVDKDGNIYIADVHNNRVRKVTASSGIISTFAGGGKALPGNGGQATSAFLEAPRGLAVDDSNNVYIADWMQNRIYKVSAQNGSMTTVAGGGYDTTNGAMATSALIDNPSAVALDKSGNIYIADQGNGRVKKVNVITGRITTVAGNGNYGFSGDGGAATSAMISVASIAVDDAGNVYISGDNRIRKVSATTGIIRTIAGLGVKGYSGDGGQATSAKLHYPAGMAIDSSWNVYVADIGNNCIRKIAVSFAPISENTISGHQSVCYGKVPVASLIGSLPSGGNDSYVFTWLKSTINATKGFEPITSSNTANYLLNQPLTQNTWYKRVVSSMHFIDTSSAIMLSVKQNPTKPVITFLNENTLQSTPANAYQWYIYNNILPNETNQTLTINRKGNYSVKIDSSNGCNSTSETFVVNNVGLDEVSETPIFNIYPNPTSGKLNIESSLSQEHNLCIFDVCGKEILNHIVFQKSTTLELSNLFRGIYMIQITNDDIIFRKKIVIE